jgi:ABC-2 type transport system permease protein
MTAGSALLGPALSLAGREVIRFFRQRSRIVGALGTPILFWILMGSGLGTSFRLPGAEETNFLEYFFPGTLVMILLFAAIFSTFSIIEDRNAGFLQGVLAAPVSRQGIVLGKILGGGALAFVQAVLFLILAPTVGISPPFTGWVLLLPILFLIALSLTALGFYFAWHIDSTQGFHSIMNLVMIPMWLLSGALFPMEGAFVWVKWMMAVNPLTYGVAAVRRCLYWGSSTVEDLPGLGISLAVTLLFGVVMFALSARAVGVKKAANLQ